MVQLALRSALSDRAAEERVVVVPEWPMATPRTKDAVSALATLGLDGRVLVVLAQDDEVAARSFANLPQVQLVLEGELNTYDVLRNDWVVFTDATLPGNSAVVAPEAASPEPSGGADAEPEEHADGGEEEEE
jgi:large subunit ribosomal protein L4